MDDLLRLAIGPIIGLAIAGISGGLVFWLIRRTHAEKDDLAASTLSLLEDANKELRTQNGEYREKVDANAKQIATVTGELKLWQERVTQRAAVDELASWGSTVAAAARDRDEAMQRALSELRADTARWQAEEAHAREEGRRATSSEHSALVGAVDALRAEIAKMGTHGGASA